MNIYASEKMNRSEYKILIFDGNSVNINRIKKILAPKYKVISPKDNEEAVKVIAKERIDLAIMSPKSFKLLQDKLAYNKRYLNPNLIKILIAGYSQVGEMMILEESGQIYGYVETPVSAKEIKLIIRMAFKNLEMLIDRNRLVAKLNQKTTVLLNQQKKLSDALERLNEANLDAIRVLSEAIEAKDPYTRGHCKRVSKLAKAIAEHMGYDDKMMKKLELGAFLHDIGKIGIKGAVLNKNGRLSEEEMEHVKMHTVIGENIIKTVPWCRKFISIIRSHHEMMNGKGYPDGLSGDEIPMDARILGIADAFDAMTSERPYRNALPLEEALRRIKTNSGTQFDSDLVDIFISRQIYKQDLSSITGVSFRTDPGKKTKKTN